MSVPAVMPWWDGPPRRQVSFLAGVEPELLTVALDPLPPGSPAFVWYRPGPVRTLDAQVAALLTELDRTAAALFPHWLPGAHAIVGPHDLGVAAVRALAEQSAARSRNFGPFLADLAERSLRRAAGRQDARSSARFPAEVRAAGLARVLADAYGRTSIVMVIEVPETLGPREERTLAAAAEWLVQRSGFAVWLAGGPLRSTDRIRSVTLHLPAHLTGLIAEVEALAVHDATVGVRERPAGGPAVTYPPLSGFPRGDSPAEQALERALAPHDWADGRRWNHTYEPAILGKQYRLDLFWAAERLVVEVDGEDHRGAVKFADDRRRDVRLQIHGHDVLRFTNEQVLSDVQAVVHDIKVLLDQRRANRSNSIEKRHRVAR